MTKVAVIIAAVVVAAMAVVFLRIGVFDTITFSEEPKGPYRLIYREYRGAYRTVPFVVNAVFTYARDTLLLPTATPFAVYYDRPALSGGDSLRCIGGVLVDSVPSLKRGLFSGTFHRTDAVVGSFRLRGFFSPAIGGHKFYSALPRFLEKMKLHQRGPVMEIYDPRLRRIYFIAPTGKPEVPFPPFSDDT